MYRTLREIREEVGVSRRAIQGYENLMMVSSSKHNKYGHLLYSEEEVERIRMIKQYQEWGFSLKEIQKLLVATQEEFVEMLTYRLEKLKQQKKDMESHIAKITSMLGECNG